MSLFPSRDTQDQLCEPESGDIFCHFPCKIFLVYDRIVSSEMCGTQAEKSHLMDIGLIYS